MPGPRDGCAAPARPRHGFVAVTLGVTALGAFFGRDLIGAT
jgi:hypothetical protein